MGYWFSIICRCDASLPWYFVMFRYYTGLWGKSIMVHCHTGLSGYFRTFSYHKGLLSYFIMSRLHTGRSWYFTMCRFHRGLFAAYHDVPLPCRALRVFHCPACRTTLVATRFRVAVICPIIQVPHCIRVFFYFVWFVFINHIFQFYYELCTYCNILDIYLS